MMSLPRALNAFFPGLEIEEDGQQVTPCFSNQGINYMHIRHSICTVSDCTVQNFMLFHVVPSSRFVGGTPMQRRSFYSFIAFLKS